MRGFFGRLITILYRIAGLFRRPRELDDPRKILIVKTHAIGDVLFTTPAIRALKGRFPNASLVALVGKWSKSVLEGNSHLDHLLTFDDAILFNYRLFSIFGLIRRIRKEAFDCAFIFQPSIFVQCMIWFAGIPIRVGFDDSGLGGTLTKAIPWRIDDTVYIAHSFLELSRVAGAEGEDTTLEFPLTTADEEFADRFIEEHRQVLFSGEGIIGICPGGGVNPRDKVFAKLWHIDNYVELVRKLYESHDLRFIVFGSKDDSTTIGRLIRYCSPCDHFLVNACERTTLKQTGALFERCRMIITNDSAPLHIAIARGVPTLSIFGPTNHHCLLPNDVRHVAVQSGTSCSPCYHNSPFPGCDRIVCMEKITVAKVVEQAELHLRSINDFRDHPGI